MLNINIFVQVYPVGRMLHIPPCVFLINSMSQRPFVSYIEHSHSHSPLLSLLSSCLFPSPALLPFSFSHSLNFLKYLLIVGALLKVFRNCFIYVSVLTQHGKYIVWLYFHTVLSHLQVSVSMPIFLPPIPPFLTLGNR